MHRCHAQDITVFTFGLRTFGWMNTDYNIDVVAYPTNAPDSGQMRFGQPIQ